MTDLPLEKLREYRSCNVPIVRGSIPVIGFNENYLIEKIILSILIFIFSVVISGGIFGSKIGIIIGAFFVSLYLFWPIYYVKYIEHKTKQRPTEEILNRFSNRYKGLKEYMRKNGFVTIIEKSVVEEPAPKVIPVETNAFRLWLGTTTWATGKSLA